MLESCQFVSFSELCYLGHLEFLYYYYWVNKNQLSPLLKIIYSQISRQEYLTFQCPPLRFFSSDKWRLKAVAVDVELVSCFFCGDWHIIIHQTIIYHHHIIISSYHYICIYQPSLYHAIIYRILNATITAITYIEIFLL